MARPRKPTNVLHLAGAFRKNPQRLAARANEPKPGAPLGDPPTWMDARERECWHWIADRCPPGVLTNADEGALELAAEMRALVVKRKADGETRRLLKALYTELGMTPASRSKVHAKTGDDRPTNEFAAV